MRDRAWLLILLVTSSAATARAAERQPRVIHVFVALADNANQGIVPVPAKLGDGEDAANNLYWGARYGVKTFFRKHEAWSLLATEKVPKPTIIERVVFEHRTLAAILIADAYRGPHIEQAITDFLAAAAGHEHVRVARGAQSLMAGGAAQLLVYVGHDGLMDFELRRRPPEKANDDPRAAIILACESKRYFAAPLRATGATPLLWTTGLMAPEAYTLEAAVNGWLAGESAQRIHERAAVAYDEYQKCGLKGARRLFATGW